MLHSIYDLTTSCRKTTGDVPAKLVGASTTVVGSKMYLFGGRQVSERRMVSDLYVFDLETLVWAKLPSHPEDDIPRPRYFHSSDSWNNQLIIFGGMSNQPDSPNPDELCVLNDVRFFDLTTGHWLPSSQTVTPVNDSLIPRARYAHLSSVTANRLFIIGGQDFFNTWLDDVCVYDLLAKTWVQRRDYPRHCGTYRSVAVSSHLTVRLPQEEVRAYNSTAPVARFRTNSGNNNATPSLSSANEDFTPPESLVYHPYSTTPTKDHPSDIYLYSNYNFTDVKRELEVFSPLPDSDFNIEDRSPAMGGTTFPPGLRFPTGAILGTNLIIAGTYLAHSYQSFSIWVLDLLTMHWARIDPGKAVETGSWFRGCLSAESNKFFIFGNRDGNLVDDYNRRLLSWEHVAVVDLEAFGIYQPPPLRIDLEMQELGLSALEEGVMADFEVVCEDGRKIPCSRRILEERWGWFKDQRRKLLESALTTMEGLPTSPMHVSQPELPGVAELRADPRLTPRALHLSEPYPITLALLQYFYSLALITPLQQAPAVLSQLLVLATNYQITHLETLVRHAMHRALSNSTSVGVYEVATLCNCRSLQIRALKTVMSYTQKRPKSKSDKEHGGGGRPPGPDGRSHDGPSNGGGHGPDRYARPRGTSDAKWRTAPSLDPGPSSNNYSSRPDVARLHRSPPLSDSDDVDSSSPSEDHLGTLPLFTKQRARHDRTVSVVSMGTDKDLRDTVDLLMPTLSDPPNRPTHNRATSDDASDSVLETPHLPMQLHHPQEADPSEEEEDDLFFSRRPQLSRPPTSSDSEYEVASPSEQVDRMYLPPTSGGFYTPYHLPNGRPRPIYTGTMSDYSSDTPSLTSRSSSLSSSSRHLSPRTPSLTEFPAHSLPLIEERQMEDNDSMMSSRVQRASDSYASERSSEQTTRSWPKQKSNVEWLQKTQSVDSNIGTILPIPESPPSTRKGLGRLLGKKEGKNPVKEYDAKVSAGNKAAKAEEKKRKAEEKKLRTERLAAELKARTQQRKQAALENASLNSAERKAKGPASMFGGMSADLVM